MNESGETSIEVSNDLHHRLESLHVLYVEDSATMRHTTEKLLSPYFDHIDSTSDGALGLELYRNFYKQHKKNYDIVITDLEMPNMDGKELASAIFSIDPLQEVIIISSSGDLGLLIDLINMGVRKFLLKPIDAQQLHNTISEVATNLRLKKLKEDELTDISQDNILLKRRENIYLNKLEKSFQALSEINDVLNESGVVSKTNLLGIITYVNSRFCELSGYSEEELLGKKHSLVGSGEMPSSFFEKLWDTITAKKIYKGIFKNRTKAGKIYYVDQFIKPIIDTHGELIEYIAIGHDITQMMESIEIAKHAEEDKDDFFRNISHEMRTPLNSILGLTSLLKRRSKDNIKLLDMLNIIENNSQNLSNLVESILDLQRLQHNNLVLQIKEFEPSTLYSSIIRQNESKALEKNLTLEYTIDPDVPAILMGDESRIHQIIMAVMDNAIKFSLKYGKVTFHLSYSYGDSMLIAQVSDNGIGISVEDQEKIFHLTQLDASLSRKHEGSGIGLTLSNALIKKMGGTFTVHSIPDVGSTFLLEFPLRRL